MPEWSALLTSVAVVGVLALILRWAFSGRPQSLVERRARPGPPADYGLMVAIASPGNYIEGERDRARLEAAGIRAQLVTTTSGPRLMVLEEDEAVARALLAS